MIIPFESKSCVICGNPERFHELVTTEDRRVHQPIRTVICPYCGLVFANPAPTEEGYLSYHRMVMSSNIKAPEKESLVRKKKNLATLQIRFIKDCLGDLSSLDAVDVGSGWGGFLYYLKPEVKTLVATEILPPVKDFIEKEFQCPVFISARLAEVFPPESFDLITATALIEHQTHPLSFVLDCARALKPGGHLFLFTPDVKGMCFAQGVDQYFKFLHPYNYSVNSLRSLLSKAGFGDFQYWTSRPDFSVRSVRNPVHVVAGDIFMLAQKREIQNRKALLFKDDPADIIEIFNKQKKIEDRFQKKRAIWLSPWAKPLRGLARLLPKRSMDMYQPMLNQYNSRHIMKSRYDSD